jgi:hypothetical protein
MNVSQIARKHFEAALGEAETEGYGSDSIRPFDAEPGCVEISGNTIGRRCAIRATGCG